MAAAEIALRDSQLDDRIGKVKSALKRIDKSDRKAQELDEIEELCKDCETDMELMRMEFRNLSPDDKVKYREKLKAHRADLKQIRNDLEWAKQANTKKELIGDRKDKLEDLDLDSAGGMMQFGRGLQNESVAALQRTVGVVGDTQQVGRDTALKVQAQTEQIKKMYDDLYEIDDMLKRSRKIITRMLKKTASSKTVWVLTGCVVIGIAIIIYFKVK